ncbi:hypothetical protein KAX22_03110 [bacterium]|nr:hypothetical protein [bacterium]
MPSYRPRFRTVALFLALLVALAASGYAGETCTSQTLLSAPWGSDPGQFGLIREAEGVGPQSLNLDSAGNIYIVDLVNRRVQVFTPRGAFLRETACGILAHDICLDQEGALYLLAPYHGLVEKFDPGGQLLDRWPVSPEIWLIDGMRIADNQVILHTALQTEHTIADAKGPRDPQSQLNEVQMGFSGPDPTRRYRTQWVDDHLGLLQFLDGHGHKLRDVRVTTQEVLGSLVFVGADADGNVYLRAEMFGPDNTGQKIFKYDDQGNLLAEFSLSTGDFTFIYRSLYLAPNGDLYQLLTGPQGVNVLRWQAVHEAREER